MFYSVGCLEAMMASGIHSAHSGGKAMGVPLRTCIVLCEILCDISLVLDSEKTNHITMISMKLSRRECICNYKQIDLKFYSDSQ